MRKWTGGHLIDYEPSYRASRLLKCFQKAGPQQKSYIHFQSYSLKIHV